MSEFYQKYTKTLTEGGNWMELELLWTRVVTKRKEILGADATLVLGPLI